MFKNLKHTYTCPDVIYLRNRQKKVVAINLVATLLFIAALNVYGHLEEDKWTDELEDTLPDK